MGEAAAPSEVTVTPEEQLQHLSQHQLDGINKIIELLEGKEPVIGGPRASDKAHDKTAEYAEDLLRSQWNQYREHFDPYALPDPQKPRAVANSLDLVTSHGRTHMRLEIEGELSQQISYPLGTRAPPCKLELLGYIVGHIPKPTDYHYIPLTKVGRRRRWFEVTFAQTITINEHGRECVRSSVPQPLVNGNEEDPQLRYHRDRADDLKWLKHAPTRGGRQRLEAEAWPYWREQADQAIRLRNQGYTWPRVHERMSMPLSTVRRWVSKRQEELSRDQLPGESEH
jgi:hypothetical protein